MTPGWKPVVGEKVLVLAGRRIAIDGEITTLPEPRVARVVRVDFTFAVVEFLPPHQGEAVVSFNPDDLPLPNNVEIGIAPWPEWTPSLDEPEPTITASDFEDLDRNLRQIEELLR